jgi:hypothetical protein
LFVLLVPVIGYLAVSNIEATRGQQDRGAQNDADAQIIAYMHQNYDSGYPATGYQWTVGRRDGSTSLVCYCNKKGYGWWYSVRMTSDGRFSAAKVADTSKGATPP